VEVIDDDSTPQIEEVLATPPVAGSVASPLANVCQGMLDWRSLPQLDPAVRYELSFPQFLQEPFIRMDADTAAGGTGGAALAQGTDRTLPRGKCTVAPGSKGMATWLEQRNP
jgi:hypothetical protein